MAVLVDTLYGEKCCNKDIGKISYKICKQCEFKVSLSKTFVTCHLDTNKNKGEITMAEIKSFTTLEQSKKLAEILPIESADMYYACGARVPDIMIGSKQDYRCYTVCWSLAALLSIMPTFTIDSSDDHHFRMQCCHHFSQWHNSLIDACYEMILKLRQLNLL